MNTLFVDVNRCFGHYHSGIDTAVFVFTDDGSVGYLVRFNPDTGLISCEVC